MTLDTIFPHIRTTDIIFYSKVTVHKAKGHSKLLEHTVKSNQTTQNLSSDILFFGALR